MRALLTVLTAFVGGLLLGATSYRARTAVANLLAALPGPLAPWKPMCADIYAGAPIGARACAAVALPPAAAAFCGQHALMRSSDLHALFATVRTPALPAGAPLSPAYSVGDMQPNEHPIPGLAHITLHGRKAHGMRGLELWMETFAPGAATPIHRWGGGWRLGEQALLLGNGAGQAVRMQLLRRLSPAAGMSARRFSWCSRGRASWRCRARCAPGGGRARAQARLPPLRQRLRGGSAAVAALPAAERNVARISCEPTPCRATA